MPEQSPPANTAPWTAKNHSGLLKASTLIVLAEPETKGRTHGQTGVHTAASCTVAAGRNSERACSAPHRTTRVGTRTWCGWNPRASRDFATALADASYCDQVHLWNVHTRSAAASLGVSCCHQSAWREGRSRRGEAAQDRRGEKTSERRDEGVTVSTRAGPWCASRREHRGPRAAQPVGTAMCQSLICVGGGEATPAETQRQVRPRRCVFECNWHAYSIWGRCARVSTNTSRV